MRILLISDIHHHYRFLDKLKHNIDLLIFAGDITTFMGSPEVEQFVKYIARYFNTYYGVVGNTDLHESNEVLDKRNINLHGHGIYFQEKEYGLFGCGGSSFSPFKTPNEYTEDELNIFLNAGYHKVKDAKIKIMVCHTPPFMTECDRTVHHKHVGAKTVREFIEKNQPDFCFTGHIHESIGIDHIGKTVIINPGPYLFNRYAIIDLKKKEIELLKYIPKIFGKNRIEVRKIHPI